MPFKSGIESKKDDKRRGWKGEDAREYFALKQLFTGK